MRFSAILHRGDIVLVPFPFTDPTGQKVRPAVIVSPDPIGEDLVLAFITSVAPLPLLSTDYLLEKSHPDFHLTGLRTTSVFRMAKLVTLHRSLILRRLGKVPSQIRQDLDRRLEEATGLQSP
jgi:mRNA interferase MazF